MKNSLDQAEKPSASPPESQQHGIKAAVHDAYPIGGSAKAGSTSDTSPQSKTASLSLGLCNPHLPNISVEDWNGAGPNSSQNFPHGLEPYQAPPAQSGGDGKAPSKPPEIPPWMYENQPCPPTKPALTS
jgi:hypothetical protein